MKSGSFDKLDEALYIWLKQQRERGSPITGPILMEKASFPNFCTKPATTSLLLLAVAFNGDFASDI